MLGSSKGCSRCLALAPLFMRRCMPPKKLILLLTKTILHQTALRMMPSCIHFTIPVGGRRPLNLFQISRHTKCTNFWQQKFGSRHPRFPIITWALKPQLEEREMPLWQQLSGFVSIIDKGAQTKSIEAHPSNMAQRPHMVWCHLYEMARTGKSQGPKAV